MDDVMNKAHLRRFYSQTQILLYETTHLILAFIFLSSKDISQPIYGASKTAIIPSTTSVDIG